MKFFLFATAVMLISCNANDQSSGESDKVAVPVFSKANLTFGCYQMIVERDSAFMQLNLTGVDSVTGSLRYNRFEKDDNAGNFIGKIDSNKVVGWYKFQSEGVVTVRQVVFKITGDRLAEGYGDVKATGDTAYFPYPHTLNYEETHPFEKVSCP